MERFWQGLDILENTRPFRYIAWLRELGDHLQGTDMALALRMHNAASGLLRGRAASAGRYSRSSCRNNAVNASFHGPSNSGMVVPFALAEKQSAASAPDARGRHSIIASLTPAAP